MPGLELMGKIGLDAKAFEAELHNAKHIAHGVAEGITDGLKRAVLAGVGVVTVEEAMRKTVETANELVEASERLGIGVEKLQVLRQAAKLANTDLETLATTFEKIGVARQKALISGPEGQNFRRAFGAFGVTGAQLHSLSAADLLTGPMAAMARNTNPEQLGVLFRELGIKGFGPLINFLRTDFEKLGEKMNRFGAIMSGETALAIKKVSDEVSIFSRIIVSQVGPALVKLAEWAYEIALKGGKAAAGVGGFLGAGLAGKGPVETAVGLHAIATYGFAAMAGRALNMATFGKFGLSKEGAGAFLDNRLDAIGFNRVAAKGAMGTAEEPWLRRQREFEETLKRLAEEAEALRHQHPDLSASMLPEKLSAKALLSPTDSLVKVGNFLGGKGVGLEHRKVDLLQQIANNTRFAWKPVGNPKLHSYELSPVSFPHR